MPTLVKRKLITMGAGGLVVCIPKPWWTYYGLKAGDEVQVIANGELCIRPVTAHNNGKFKTKRDP